MHFSVYLKLTQHSHYTPIKNSKATFTKGTLKNVQQAEGK